MEGGGGREAGGGKDDATTYGPDGQRVEKVEDAEGGAEDDGFGGACGGTRGPGREDICAKGGVGMGTALVEESGGTLVRNASEDSEAERSVLSRKGKNLGMA